MIFESIVPILYSADVARSLAYYMDQLAFDEKWEWDNPTTFGGVSSVCKKTLLLKHFTSVSSIKIVFDSSIFSKEVSNPEFSLIYPFFITSFCMCGT